MAHTNSLTVYIKLCTFIGHALVAHVRLFSRFFTEKLSLFIPSSPSALKIQDLLDKYMSFSELSHLQTTY